jgi:hypothetical protein
MCYAVFLASDRPLPLVPWDPSRRALHVSHVERHEAAARQAFSQTNRHVYYVGSDLHCGCGFFEHEDEARVTSQYGELARYIRDVVPPEAQLEVFVSWERDLADGLPSVGGRREVRVEDLIAPGFRLVERELLRIVRQ